MHIAAVDLERQITSMSMKTALVASLVLGIFTLISIWASKGLPKKSFNKLKLPLFLVMAGTIIGATGIMAFNTVYLNVKAESKGPVHWHADIEFWACGGEVELRDPTGFLSNKIGTSTYHEHNDKRIHLEGVVIDKHRDASLGKFMEVTGGYINDTGVGIPLNKNPAAWSAAEGHRDGDKQKDAFLAEMEGYVNNTEKGPVLRLGDGSGDCEGQAAELQVFVYRYNKDNKTYQQLKIAHPADYVIRDESVVPPGDCIIVEFDTPKSATDKICNQYGVRDADRCLEFGVTSYESDLCNIRQVDETEGN